MRCFPNAYDNLPLAWRKDSSAVTFEYNQRGHQVYRVIEIDALTGQARAVIAEEPKTFFAYSGKRYRFDVADGKDTIWMSERDGWNHLYLYDGATGTVKQQITKGNWVVRSVVGVDEEKRQIWFSASGMYPGKDPYFVALLPHQLRRHRASPRSRPPTRTTSSASRPIAPTTSIPTRASTSPLCRSCAAARTRRSSPSSRPATSPS